MSRPLVLRAACGSAAIAALVLSTSALAVAQTVASMRISLHPDRPGALAVLSVAIRYEDPHAEVPAPLRSAVLRLPEALNMEIPQLRSCSSRTLRMRGVRGCPRQSRIGVGEAIARAQAGSGALSEHIALDVFLGPLMGSQPTFETLARGYTPFEKRVVIGGTVVPDEPPHGEDLEISVPPISTLPLEPDASLAALSLAIGSSGATRRAGNAVLVSSDCPSSGLPFALESTFADGSSSTAVAFVPCPTNRKRKQA